MPLRHATEFPERFLDPCAECLERFAEAKRNRFDVAVGQHAMKQQVVKSLAGDLDTQSVHDRKVAGGQSPGVMLLGKVDWLVGTVQRSPLGHPSFEGAASRIGELTRVLFLQPLKQCLGFEPWLLLESLFDRWPDLGEQVTPRAILQRGFTLRGQPSVIAVAPRRLLIHLRHPC